MSSTGDASKVPTVPQSVPPLVPPSVSGSKDLESQIRIELSNLDTTTRDPFIYKIPENLRNVKTEAYTPFRVAIGPIHSTDQQLKSMDEYKLRCLSSLMSRSGGQTRLKDYAAAIEQLESKAWGCYAGIEDITGFSRDDFKKMLLIDGAFILEFFCRVVEEKSNANPNHKALNRMRTSIWRGVHVSDPMSTNLRTRYEICRDLILLENQLPFFVLETLFDRTFGKSSENLGTTLGEIAYLCLKVLIPFRNNKMTFSDARERIENGQQVMHLVHFMRLCCLPFPEKQPTNRPSANNQAAPQKCCLPCTGNNNGAGFSFCCIRLSFRSTCWDEKEKRTDEFRPVSVTDLHEAGVHFMRVEKSNQLLDITFNNGVVQMPRLRLDETTETFFRNIMAFEQYHLNKYEITNFVYFMDRFIDTTSDVQILEESKLLDNWLESKENVTTIFNNITRHTATDFGDYMQVSRAMATYTMKPWNKWKAMLRRDYFGSPWAFISFFAALVLVGLTIVQTIASIRSTTW